MASSSFSRPAFLFFFSLIIPTVSTDLKLDVLTQALKECAHFFQSVHRNNPHISARTAVHKEMSDAELVACVEEMETSQGNLWFSFVS